MKISHETGVDASMETVWNALTDFSRYPEWNPVITSVEGVAGPEAALTLTVKLSGARPRRTPARVTGFNPPRYFSLEIAHPWGAWFLQEEWIFRMKEHAGGLRFIAEAYVTGLGLRFRRSGVEGAFSRSLANLVYALKDRLAASA